MINNIKKYLNIILEIEAKVKTPILINPSLSEIKKLIYNSERNAKLNYSQFKEFEEEDVRYVVYKNNYYFADANEYVHNDIMKEFKVPYENSFEGGLKKDGYIWFYRRAFLDYLNVSRDDQVNLSHEDIINLFKSTDFYKFLSPFITEIEYE